MRRRRNLSRGPGFNIDNHGLRRRHGRAGEGLRVDSGGLVAGAGGSGAAIRHRRGRTPATMRDVARCGGLPLQVSARPRQQRSEAISRRGAVAPLSGRSLAVLLPSRVRSAGIEYPTVARQPARMCHPEPFGCAAPWRREPRRRGAAASTVASCSGTSLCQDRHLRDAFASAPSRRARRSFDSVAPPPRLA